MMFELFVGLISLDERGISSVTSKSTFLRRGRPFLTACPDSLHDRSLDPAVLRGKKSLQQLACRKKLDQTWFALKHRLFAAIVCDNQNRFNVNLFADEDRTAGPRDRAR